MTNAASTAWSAKGPSRWSPYTSRAIPHRAETVTANHTVLLFTMCPPFFHLSPVEKGITKWEQGFLTSKSRYGIQGEGRFGNSIERSQGRQAYCRNERSTFCPMGSPGGRDSFKEISPTIPNRGDTHHCFKKWAQNVALILVLTRIGEPASACASPKRTLNDRCRATASSRGGADRKVIFGSADRNDSSCHGRTSCTELGTPAAIGAVHVGGIRHRRRAAAHASGYLQPAAAAHSEGVDL